MEQRDGASLVHAVKTEPTAAVIRNIEGIEREPVLLFLVSGYSQSHSRFKAAKGSDGHADNRVYIRFARLSFASVRGSGCECVWRIES